MKYHDNSTFATDSINIDLDVKKLKFLVPEIFTPFQRMKYQLKKLGFSSYIERISEHIKFGDSQGAVVMNTRPLLIAAYNVDIDCVVMLRFEDKVQDKYNFEVRDSLVCVNTFGRTKQYQNDLVPGKNNSGVWTLVHPIVANLVSNSTQVIEHRKEEIGKDGYNYIWELGKDYLKNKKGIYRNGKPFYAAHSR